MVRKALLVRVGAEKNRDGGYSPLLGEGLFEYIPILEDIETIEVRTFNTIVGKHGAPFSTYMNSKKSDTPVHYDPYFGDIFTFGDGTSQRNTFLKLSKGDLLVFYATFAEFQNNRMIWDTKNVHIYGYFTVYDPIDGKTMNCGFNMKELDDALFDKYDTKYYDMLIEDWQQIPELEELPDEITENAHFKNYIAFHEDIRWTCEDQSYLSNFVVISGDPEQSKLLEKAILIADIIPGTYPFQLKKEYATAWNLFSKKTNAPMNITRKVPYWIRGDTQVNNLMELLGIN